MPFAIKTSCFARFFAKIKKLNLELEGAFSEIASLRSAYDDMSVKPCDKYNMIMINYVNLWLIHSHVASLLDGARLKLMEFKAHSTLLSACTSCPLLKSNLEAVVVEIKDIKHKLNHSSRYTVLSPLCEACVSLKGMLFYATKENIELQWEVGYLTARLQKTALSVKKIEDDLSRVEKSATKSTYKLGVDFERCGDKSERSAPKFVPSSNNHKEEEALKPTKINYPSNPKPSFNSKREVRKETPKPREEAFVCIFCDRAGHLDEICFRRKRIERRRLDYARNSYCDEFSDFPFRSFPRALPQFAHGPNHRSYGFGSQENRFEPRRFGYGPRSHRGERFPRRHIFLLDGTTPTLSRDTWMIHIFPVVVHVSLSQVVRCK
jgi:hypothetical protein